MFYILLYLSQVRRGIHPYYSFRDSTYTPGMSSEDAVVIIYFSNISASISFVHMRL